MAWFNSLHIIYLFIYFYFASLIPSPKLSVIVVRKKCLPRFLTETGRTLQNPPPGTVVDSGATRPEWQVC